jgi:hypothetical protein
MKIINLVIIFISLQYLIPLLDLKNILIYPYLINICISLIIGLIQFIYNYIKSFVYKKEITFKEIKTDSLYKSFSVLVGFILFYFIKNRYSDLFSNSEYNKYNEYFTSLFITLLITFFILIKCLITP